MYDIIEIIRLYSFVLLLILYHGIIYEVLLFIIIFTTFSFNDFTFNTN